MDLSYLKLALDNDSDALREILTAALEDTPGLMDSLKDVWSKGDLNETAAQAHRFKSTMGNLGCTHATSILSSLEDAAKAQELEKAGELLRELKPLVETLIRDLAQEIEGL